MHKVGPINVHPLSSRAPKEYLSHPCISVTGMRHAKICKVLLKLVLSLSVCGPAKPDSTQLSTVFWLGLKRAHALKAQPLVCPKAETETWMLWPKVKSKVWVGSWGICLRENSLRFWPGLGAKEYSLFQNSLPKRYNSNLRS